MSDRVRYIYNGEVINSQKSPHIVPEEGETVTFKTTGPSDIPQDHVPEGRLVVENVWHMVRVPYHMDDLKGVQTEVYLKEAEEDE